ncbi:MAG: hypothetical protein RRY34_07245 [Victivallaceae bacterium]
MKEDMMNDSTKIENNSLFQLLKRGVLFLLFVFVFTCTLTAAFSEISPAATANYLATPREYTDIFPSDSSAQDSLTTEQPGEQMPPFWLLENQHSVRSIGVRGNNSNQNKRNIYTPSALLPDKVFTLDVPNEENCNNWGPENRSLSICLHTAPVRAGPDANIFLS